MSDQLITLFRLVVEASWQSSLIILLILMVRPLMGARIPARWRYWLWAPVLIRLLVPVSVLPSSPVSIQNIAIVDQPLEQLGLPALPPPPVMESAPSPRNPPVAEVTPQRSTTPEPVTTSPVSLWLVISAIWLAGTLLAASLMASAQIFLRWRLARDQVEIDPKIIAIWNRCCDRLQFTRRPTLGMSAMVVSPSLVGMIRPILLLPQKNFAAYSPEDWENIFIHELAHYRCGDHWTNVVQLAAMIVHWFNPVLWMAFRQLRADRELSADEWALRHLEIENSVAYGETLLKVLVQSSEPQPLLSSVGILEDRVQLKERLQRIVGTAPRTLIGSMAGLAIVAVVALLVLGRASDKVDLSNYPDMKPAEILISAAHRSDLPVIRNMLAQGVDINVLADVDGMNSPLSAAAAANQMDAVRLLVAKGADVNREAEGVWSPLKAAMEAGRTECAHELIKNGATCSEARLAALDGDEPVLKAALAAQKIDLDELKILCAFAATNGRTDCFRLLMQNIRTHPGETNWGLDDWHVLFVIARGHRDTLAAILEESPYANNLNKTGVMRLGPALEENPGMRDWLLAKGYTIPAYTSNEKLIDATEHEDLPEMDRLLKAGADVNYRGESSWTPLTKAAAWNKPRAAKFLLAHGADPNTVHLPGWDYSPICLTSKPEIADMVLAAGGHINAQLYGNTSHIMSYCVTFGPVEMVKWFIDHGVEPSKLTSKQDGQTLLFDAANAAIAELLIQHGVPVDAKSNNGGTALLQQCAWGRKAAETAEILLKHGADPNAADKDGMTPLMRAKDGATVDVLVKYGADLKVKSKDGIGLIELGGNMADVSRIKALIRDGVPFDLKTDGLALLVSSAWMNKLDIMSFLLDRGVDPNAAGSWNKQAKVTMKPLVAATVAGHEDGVQLLLDHGAKADDQVMRDALYNRRVSIVKTFWEHGDRGIPELTYAVSQGTSVPELEKIVAQENSGKIAPDFGAALQIATLLGDFPAVQFLVEKQNSISGNQGAAREVVYSAPLASAASEGQDEIVHYLIQQGAKPNWSAVMSATNNATPYNDQRDKSHFEKTVQILITAGALKGISEQTMAEVLQSAIFTRQGPGNLAVVKMLTDAGLNLEARGKDGKTPMQVAQENYKRSSGRLPSAELMAFLEKIDKR